MPWCDVITSPLRFFSALRVTQKPDGLKWETFCVDKPVQTSRGPAIVKGISVNYVLLSDVERYTVSLSAGQRGGKPNHFTEQLSKLP